MTPATEPPLFPQPLLDALENDPDRPALEHGSRVVSRGELLALVGDLVGGLRDAGLGRGSGVALHTAITPEAFAANIAAHVLGCRVVGIRPGWDRPQIDRVLADGIDALVGDPSRLTPDLVIGSGPAVVLSLGAHPDAVDLLDRVGEVAPITVEARPDDIARVNFTSGSTGQPKACGRTYRTYSLDFRPDRWAPDLARLVACFDRFLVHHSLAVPVMLTFAGRCLMIGGTAVLAGEDDDPLLPGAIERHRISGIVMIVPLLQQMLERLRDDPVDLGSLRAVVVTGSPASRNLLVAAVERLGPVVWQGYGQAESGMIALLTPDDIGRHPQAALASVGRPLPEVEISVRDADDRPVGRGETGEICVRSPHVMAGYWGEPELTREVIRDGWLHTRDLGRLDDSGLLRLTGRSRDVILVNAEVCYAGAIEQALARHPDVDQAYVVGVPDERSGEAIYAFIVPAVGEPVPDHEELRGLVCAELTPAHAPQSITTLGRAPVAASGKPDKHALVDLARQMHRGVSGSSDPRRHSAGRAGSSRTV
jgi:fatty-acyl-CoA synthase